MDLTSFEENIKAIGTISNSLCNSEVNNANTYCTMIMPFSELFIRNLKELFENYKNYRNFNCNKLTEKVKLSAQACLEIHEYLHDDFKKVLAEWNDQSEHCIERKEVLIQKHDKEAAIAGGVAFIPGVNVVAAPVIGYRAYKNKKAAKEANNQADNAVTAAETLKKQLIEPIKNFIVAMRNISRSLGTHFSLNQNSEKINIVNSCSFAEENFRNCRGQTKPFDDNDKYVKLLANIQNFNENGWTLLHIAAAAGCKEVVKILLKHKDTYDIDINKMDKNGKAALDLATDNKHTEIAEDLLIEVNEEKDRNEEFYLINSAIEKRDINVCKLLLEEKMKKEACFLSSKLHNSNGVPRQLCRQVSKKTKKTSILHYCAWKGNDKILKFLLDNEESLGQDENGKMPLHWAASEGHETIVKYLIELNASLVNEVDNNKETALYDAVWNGHMKIIEILLKEKADINIENKNNWNPLDIALISCQPEAFIFLRKHIANNSKNTDLFNQLNGSQLDNYYRFKNNSTMGLVEKLQNVESHLNKPGNNNIDSLSFYQFFLKHIEIHEENLNDEERKNPEQYKKVLSYLRACTFSKICYLKHELGSNLIIDINEYFETIENDTKNLKDTKKHYAINYNDQYKKETEKNVQEAYNIINEIIPEMENIGNKINEEMDLLIGEAKELIEGAEENKKDLENDHKDLKNKLVLTKLLGILKITSHAMGYAVGTPFAVVGKVVEKGTEIVTSFVAEPEDKNHESKFEISPDVKSSLNRMEKICKEEQVKIAEQQLEKLEEVCSKNLKLSDILSEIKKVAGDKDSVKIVKLVHEKLKELEEEQKDELKKEEQKKEEQKDNDLIKKNKQETEMLGKVLKEIKFAETTFELCNEYQNDKVKLGKLNNAIKQAEDDIKKLKLYEENIYIEIIPKIEKMQSDICNLGNQVDKKSHVYLDLSKWKVRSSLNDLKRILRQISKGFPEIRDELTTYMDKLDEGMTTIINIYD
ncbi:12663_t:CDS:1, partial [Gigaspora rosea]